MDDDARVPTVISNALAIASLRARMNNVEDATKTTAEKIEANNRLTLTTLLVAIGSLVGIIFEYLKNPH